MRRCVQALVIGVIGALLLAACGDDDGGDVATDSVSVARAGFCRDAEDTIASLATFANLLVAPSTTVDELRDAAAEVTDDRAATETAAKELRAAIDRAARPTTTAAGATTVEPTTTVPVIEVSDESIARLEDADSAFEEAVADVDGSTPIGEASVTLTSSAFRLQVAWLAVFAEVGCLEESELGAAYEQVAAYTTALQNDLTALGVYDGPVDGIYGPETVAAVQAFQKSADLPETGLADPATQMAITAAMADKQAASVAALQTILKAGGFYTGPIDGVWSPSVEGAVKAFQKEAELPETGTVDVATLAAMLTRIEAVTSPSTTVEATTTTGVDATTTTGEPTTTIAATTTIAPATTTTAGD
jgi:peptidoglycan hydrolase-like protein with peptidoglycan-binding domain